ncbi:alpha-amylase family glycosyl hydrolase [Occallatibacter savannae]|uniref:alpha-amylase family glycosyl hydrolase n=1 Tax=Occallatibacter savannae TaxID=1002691 RepID=UPI0013A5BD50|nr:alpha-amylase family glycosyl hydrolase [Occallatibacter savannae]
MISLAIETGAPVISRIDPPNWWPSLPDPMLLVYGRNLQNAKFKVRGSRVRIERAQPSANGHYAFLQLSTKSAGAQHLRITAASAEGTTAADWELKPREPETGRHQGFSPADVMYLIMTDRFADGDPNNNQPGYDPAAPRGWHGGDLRGVDAHLDYIQKLGATTLWLTPILSNGSEKDSYHGYAAADMYAVDSHFGTLSDYLKLVRDLHSRDMKIVFDIVPNHIGLDSPWVHDPPAPDWLHGTAEHHTQTRYNIQELADPHVTPADGWDITHGWFVDSMPDLNQENPLVAKYLIENAIWWTETAGLDGLRVDTFPYVGREFWAQFHRELNAVYPKLTTVGEIYNGDPKLTSFFAGGVEHQGIDTGLYTPFDFPVFFTFRDVLLRNTPMSTLKELLGQDYLYPHPERLVTFFGNHDTKRFMSELGATPQKLKLAFVLLATLRGTPELYSGDEIAMLGADDPDNRRDFPGGFKSSSHDAFAAAGRTAAEQEMYAWTTGLFKLRAQHQAFATGEQQNLTADTTTFAFLRGENLNAGCKPGSPERILIALSKDPAERSVEIPVAQTGLEGCTSFRLLFPIPSAEVKQQAGKVLVPLQAGGAAIFSVR